MDEEFSIRGQLQRAFKNDKTVSIFVWGNYRDIPGKIQYMDKNSVIYRGQSLDGELRTTTLFFEDIVRVIVYE